VAPFAGLHERGADDRACTEAKTCRQFPDTDPRKHIGIGNDSDRSGEKDRHERPSNLPDEKQPNRKNHCRADNAK